MTHLDGNTLSGILSNVFVSDVTAARGRCAHCGDVAAIAQSMLYLTPMGAVARCHSCHDVILTIVETPDGYSISLSGLTVVKIPGAGDVGTGRSRENT